MLDPIPAPTLRRLPLYLSYLKALPKDSLANISSTVIASELELNDVQVRKDLAAITDGGRPRIGYAVKELVADLEERLGYRDVKSAALVGAGSLGRALLAYENFSEHQFDIAVAFDSDESVIGMQIRGKRVISSDKIENLCGRMKIRLGIITVPEREAQEICDRLVGAGVLAIWNLTSAKLSVPECVMVINERIGDALPLLSQHLTENI
ncbi:MAG: redox-sensing transcriptional repressor Rex [Oscillospiraceae bacterium]